MPAPKFFTERSGPNEFQPKAKVVAEILTAIRECKARAVGGAAGRREAACLPLPAEVYDYRLLGSVR